MNPEEYDYEGFVLTSAWGNLTSCETLDDCRNENRYMAVCQKMIFDKELGPGCTCKPGYVRGGENCNDMSALSTLVFVGSEIVPFILLVLYYKDCRIIIKSGGKKKFKWNNSAGKALFAVILSMAFDFMITICQFGLAFPGDASALAVWDMVLWFSLLSTVSMKFVAICQVGLAWLTVINNSQLKSKSSRGLNTNFIKWFLLFIQPFAFFSIGCLMAVNLKELGILVIIPLMLFAQVLYSYAGRKLYNIGTSGGKSQDASFKVIQNAIKSMRRRILSFVFFLFFMVVLNNRPLTYSLQLFQLPVFGNYFSRFSLAFITGSITNYVLNSKRAGKKPKSTQVSAAPATGSSFAASSVVVKN